jgi:ectoine hydroxylase
MMPLDHSEAAMRLAPEELNRFMKDGVLAHRWRFKSKYIEVLLEQLPALARRVEATAFEADGQTVRALHGGFEENGECNRLTRMDVLLDPVEQILREQVYVYQFKVNLKAAFDGNSWPWHQDYSFWAKEDEMPFPRALTVGVFLDDVTEFNGPLYFIPRSHGSGCHDLDEGVANIGDDGWLKHVGASLSHQTDRSKVASMAAVHGIIAPKGPRGTILLFDCNIVHASPANMSPIDRRIMFITYNCMSNVPKNLKRPSFLVNRDVCPLQRVACSEFIEV